MPPRLKALLNTAIDRMVRVVIVSTFPKSR